MIRGAIFDVDGVLLDSMQIWNDLGARYLQKRGIAPEAGLREVLFSMSMEQGADYLKEAYSLPDTQEQIVQGIGGMLRDFYYYEVMAKPGVMEILCFLKEKQVAMALATSSPREHVARALQRNGVWDFFAPNLFTTGELGISKHQSDIYYKAAAALGTTPQETMVFEDSLYALVTAQRGGFLPVGVYDASGERNQEEMKKAARLYLKNLHELKAHWGELQTESLR